jgi:hypothetical protein
MEINNHVQGKKPLCPHNSSWANPRVGFEEKGREEKRREEKRREEKRTYSPVQFLIRCLKVFQAGLISMLLSHNINS